MQNGKVHHKIFEPSKSNEDPYKNEETRVKYLKKLRKENELLKKQLVRKWSGRSRTSLNSRLNEIDELASDSDYEDDTRLLFMEHSTFHGVRDLYISRKACIKYTWMVILLFAICGSVYGIASIVMEYIQRPYFISYFVQEAGLSSELPDVVICPFNRFNRSYLEELNVSSGLAQYLELSYPSPTIHSFQKSEWDKLVVKLDTYHQELEDLLSKVGNISYKEFINRAAIKCQAFFADESLCNNTQKIMTSAGTCFRLPSGNQSGDGFGYGNQIIVKLPKHLYHAGVNQMLNDGIAVKLVEIGRGVDNDLTFIPSGVHAIMPLKATKYEFKNDPPRYNCEENPSETYGRTCLVEEAELACNCSLAASQTHRAQQICTTNQFYTCFAKILFDEAKFFERQHFCKKRCRHPCTYWAYDKTVSYAKFPSESARAFVKDEKEWKDLHNIIILEVYFTSLDYTVIRHQTAFTFSSFIAQIGGQISLWIGGSIISIIQLVIYLCLGSWSSIKKQKKRIEMRRRSRNSGIDYEDIERIRNIYKDEKIDMNGAQI